MSSAPIIKLDLIYPGLIIELPVEGINNNGSATNDVIVQFKRVPLGLEYNGSNLERGIFEPMNLIWNIGYMAANEKNLTGAFYWKVLDDSKAPYVFELWSGLSECCDSCSDYYKVIVDGLTLTDLINAGIVRVVDEFYDDDLDAAAGGVQIGQYYRVSSTNTLGLPEGVVKMRYV